MKKLFLILMSFSICFCAYCAEQNNFSGTSLSLKPGVSLQKVSGNAHDHNVFIWQVEEVFKYQKVDSLYSSLRASYGFGRKSKDDIAHRYYKWNAEFAFGYTFSTNNDIVISPFVAIGHNNFKEKRDEENVADTTHRHLYEIKFLGMYGLLGVDLNYMFSNNVFVGLLAGLGMHVSPKVKYRKGAHESSGHSSSDTSVRWNDLEYKKYDAKKKLFFKVSIPLIYQTKIWNFGLEFNYSYFPLKLNNGDEYAKADVNANWHNFGLSFVLGACF